MKRILSLLLVFIASFGSMYSCGSNQSDNVESSGELSEVISLESFESISDIVSEAASDIVSGEASDVVSEAASDIASGETSDIASGETSDIASGEGDGNLSSESSSDPVYSSAEPSSDPVYSSAEPSSAPVYSSAEPSSAPVYSSAEPSTDDGDIIDVSGYEQYLKVAEVNETLAERGFKDFGANKDYKPLNYDVMKAVWISQFDFNTVYYSSRKQRPEAAFKRLVEQAYDNLLTLGFNTVIVQVRPNTDSFYPSAYYPWSSYVVYSYGRDASYDPLQIMIDEAHERGISFHAWINPMRGMSNTNLNKIADEYLMTDWAGTRKFYNYNSINYLNIAYEDVRQLIINGAAEIVRNYDVDGVHMDDYFYFGEEADFDDEEYASAKASNRRLTLQQFRYNNLNTLVSGIYSAIKAENPRVWFGISPAGNLDNMALTYYADVETWLSEDGYVDYIMPQIYFGMEHQTWSFSATYERWSAITTNPNIRFMAGMTWSKAVSGTEGVGDQYAGTGKNEWIYNKDVIKRSLQYAMNQANFNGYAMFCYQYLFDPLTGNSNSSISEELANAKSYMTNIIKGEIIK